MQEFSSISVSSYEAGALADRLTEQATDGWDVVAIVPTGSTVTAYLSRAVAGGGQSAPHAGAAGGDEAPEADAEHSTAEKMTVAEPSADDEAESAPGIPEAAPSIAEAESAAGTPEAEPSIAEEAPSIPEPEPASPTPEPAEPEPVAHEPAAPEPSPEPASPTPEPAAAVGEAAGEAAMAAGAAPAGWYADPSSRFELRYWDGSQWTEHVSRAGQQYTDPPVA